MKYSTGKIVSGMPLRTTFRSAGSILKAPAGGCQKIKQNVGKIHGSGLPGLHR